MDTFYAITKHFDHQKESVEQCVGSSCSGCKCGRFPNIKVLTSVSCDGPFIDVKLHLQHATTAFKSEFAQL